MSFEGKRREEPEFPAQTSWRRAEKKKRSLAGGFDHASLGFTNEQLLSPWQHSSTLPTNLEVCRVEESIASNLI